MWYEMLLLFVIGIFGGFISGLVGIGGAIIIYPALLLIPPLLGYPVMTAYIASGLTSAQVFFSTLSGTFSARKKKEFLPQLVLYMGGGMFVGSITGAVIADWLNASFVTTVYIFIAILALVLLFFKVTPRDETPHFNRLWLIMIGVIIGAVSGIVGAGGAFIITPILLAIFKLPMNTVVANSIAIAFISSVGAFVTKAVQGYIPLDLACAIILGSIIFAPIGLKVGRHIPSTVQKGIISLLIVIAITQLIF